jgi:tetratricopeptide (TPR) repeat protein
MRERKPILLFLSCVSGEFHKPDPEGLQLFRSYRDHLAQSFRKARVQIIVQEDLAQSFGDLLETLDNEVARCNVVVHLVGDMTGESPTANEIRRLRERHPDLFAGEPTLRELLSDPLPISYTQWELYLTFQHRGSPLVFLATPDTVRSPCRRQDSIQLSSQARHRQTIKALGKHWEEFHNQDDLALKIFIVLTRHGVLTLDDRGAVTQQVLGAARQSISNIVATIGQRIKKPDPLSVPVGASTSVDVLSHAYHTVAQEHGLTPQALVQLLAERQAITRAAAEELRTPEAFGELTLTQIALGNYEEAMRTATEAAQLGERALQAAPDVEQRREVVLNTWLLVADAACAAGHPDQAIAAKERGGRFIDREREPLFWADYHEPLAELFLAVARYDSAEHYIRDIIAIREEHLGENHPKLAEALLVLGRLLLARANYLGLEVVAERVLRVLGGSPPGETAGLYCRALSLLGIALMKEGRYAEAEPALRQTLAIMEQSLGQEDPNVAVFANDLATLFQKTNRLPEAEMLFRRALAVKEKSLGPEHPEVAIAMVNLGLLLFLADRWAEAETLYRRALPVYERSFGLEHPEVGVALCNLAQLLLARNRPAEAEPLLRRALAIAEKSFGPEHPNVSDSLGTLATLMWGKNRLAEAEPLLRRALVIAERSLGSEHPELVRGLNKLAVLLSTTNRQAEAEPLMRRALAICESTLVPDHPDTFSCMLWLADLLEELGKQEECDRLREQFVDRVMRTKNAVAAPVRRQLAFVFLLQSDYQRAERELHSLLKEGFEPASIRHDLVRLCLVMDHFKEAREHLAKGWALRGDAKPSLIARLLWYQLLLTMLDTEEKQDGKTKNAESLLGKLKTAMRNDAAFTEWTMEPVLKHLKGRMEGSKAGSQNWELLRALAAALGNRVNLAKLEEFPAWRDAAPQPVE